MRPIVLAFVARYLPGYKSGGPVRTIANLVSHLGDEFDIRIVTSDRDALDRAPYSGIRPDSWHRVGGAEVFYASRRTMTLRGISRLLRTTPHDLLYLNSFFDPRFTALPLLARRLASGAKRPILLAPRGEFAKGALSMKSWKKQPYILLMRALGFCREVTWQASGEHEACDIRRVLHTPASKVRIAPNLPPLVPAADSGTAGNQRDGPLRIAFVARISPNKNLDFALRVLAIVRIPVEFHIVGPVSDWKYWATCKRLIASLPGHIRVQLSGSIEHAKIAGFIAGIDLFFLPSKGENYGHAIAEALAAGTPVLISDMTPWRGLETAGVGWDLSLAAEQPFVAAIETTATRRGEERAAWRRHVSAYARERLTDRSVIEANRRLIVDTAAC